MRPIIIIATAATLFFSFTLIHLNLYNYNIGTDFTMKIKGTSNLHDWESSINDLSGTATVLLSEDGTVQIETCKMFIPVNSIKSTKGSIMDKKTYKALKANSHPNIEYKLTSFQDVKTNSSDFTANTTSTLKIAGVEKIISMPIKGKILNNGTIEITGSKDLKMTTFNINPPTALMGAMTTGDDITIEFRIFLNRD